MRAPWALLLTVVLVLPGCISDDPAPTSETTTPATKPTVEIDESRPDTAFKDVVTGPVAQPDVNATLDAAPKLIAGEWWRIRFDTPLADEIVELVRVVAAVEEEGYLIGMPHEGWYKEAIAYHSPGFGDVAFDLGYDTHNIKFEPVRFPLVEGNTWETTFATQALTASVESVEGSKATVVFTAPEDTSPEGLFFQAIGFAQTGEVMRLVYDASVHEVVRFTSGIGTYEVVEHGYDFEGWITIPRGEHTAIDYGQLGPATPGDPVLFRDIEIAGGFNRMTLMHAVFPLAPGSYSIRTTGPDGTEFFTESVGGDMVIRFYEAMNPDGTWTGEDRVVGAGVTFSMGIAYHQYDIRLPDGARRADHSHSVIR